MLAHDQRLWKKLLRFVVLPILLMLASAVFVGVHVSQHTQVSPYDEYQYIDYLDKVDSQGYVPIGDLTEELAREMISCSGIYKIGKIAPDACERGDFGYDGEFPDGGTNSANIYTPIYFGVTWVLAQPISWATGVDLVTAGRAVGAVWLGLGAVFAYLALLRLRIPLAVSATVPLLTIGSLPAWWFATFVSTDAPALMAGGVLFYLVILMLQGVRAWGWFLAAATVFTLIKPQNFTAVVFASAVLLLARFIHEDDPPTLDRKTRLTKPSIAIVGALGLILPVVLQVVWLRVRAALIVAEPVSQGIETELGTAELLRESVKFLSGLFTGGGYSQGNGVLAVVVPVLTWLLIGGVIAATVVKGSRSFIALAGFVWFGAAFLAGPAMAIYLELSGGYFTLPYRYGMPLLVPGLVIATVALARTAFWRWALVAISVGTYLLSLTPVMTGL